jgi:hypothetical protein
MKRILPLLSLLFLGFSTFAQTIQQPKPLTNAAVLELTRNGVPESEIIRTIQNSTPRFIITAESIVSLHDAGVTMPVLNQMIRSARDQQSSSPSFGVVTGTFPVKDAVGKTVRFSAWIKTEDVRNGYAGLWWRVDGRDGDNRTAIAFDNSMARAINGQPAPGNGTVRGATGTTPWTHYQIELPVDKTAFNINFGVLLTGSGAAWVDTMKVELDGQPYNNPPFDFDFESSQPKNLYLGCGGSAGCTDYKVGIDDTAAYLGHQSVKMESVTRTVAQK